jgi:hypothetical protein
MKRKGLGIGHGIGYKNLIAIYDSKIHACNAKGIKQQQYKGTYKRIVINPNEIIKRLKNAKITDLKITRKFISFKFNGKFIKNEIKINPKVGTIANWGHSLHDNRVFIDKDAKYKNQLAIHEAIEQYVSENFGLKYQQAHDIATLFERKYATMHNINWQKSQSEIFNTKI